MSPKGRFHGDNRGSNPRGDAIQKTKATLAVAFVFWFASPCVIRTHKGFDNTRSFKPGLVLDESAEDWPQADSQSPWGRQPTKALIARSVSPFSFWSMKHEEMPR